jgi:glycosyltransferase involved in cell wall biosynthesis
MLILLDCRPLLVDRCNGEKSHFIISCANILAKERGVEWLFLVDKHYREALLPGIHGVACGKPLAAEGQKLLILGTFPGRIGWKIWYDWQIAWAVKKYRPDLVMTTGGLSASRINRPQCLWMPERADPGDWEEKKGYAGIYWKRLTGSLREARTVFSFSEKDKAFITRQLADDQEADKILVVTGAADERYSPLAGEEKEKIKRVYAEGKEYFLAIVSGARPGEGVDLLKAFSRFKKRQQSNLQLVLAGTGGGPDPILPAGKLDTYKYRSDVHICTGLREEEWPPLLAASYAFIIPNGRESLGIAVLNAWKAGVPLITTVSAIHCLPEAAAEAVLYVEPGDPASVAGRMMSLYKDESLRNRLTEKGKMFAQSFSWEGAAGRVWEGILQATKTKSPIKG